MFILDFISNIDIQIVRLVREYLSCEILDKMMTKITLFGEEGIFWIALCIILLLFKKTRKAGVVMAVAMILGYAIGNMTLKPLVARPRPYSIDEGAALLIKPLSDYSFPSGHTLVCFEGAVSLVKCGYRKTGRLALLIAFLVAFSRVYLYVHYPTDVIVGALLGSAFACISYGMVNFIITRFGKTK